MVSGVERGLELLDAGRCAVGVFLVRPAVVGIGVARGVIDFKFVRSLGLRRIAPEGVVALEKAFSDDERARSKGESKIIGMDGIETIHRPPANIVVCCQKKALQAADL